MAIRFFRKTIFVFFLFSSIICGAQTNEAVAKLVKEGIALHDKGDYEGAIAKYEAALVI